VFAAFLVRMATLRRAAGMAAEGKVAGMFGRKKMAADVEPLKTVLLKVEPDDGSFTIDNDQEIEVRGFRVITTDGLVLEHTESGQIVEGIFYFRLAGATHHRGADKLDGDATSQVLLLHQPDNPHDPNAIEVLDQHGGEPAGFVPAALAPKMLP
jgi:hypothetical protein